jgi:hypothetical protein
LDGCIGSNTGPYRDQPLPSFGEDVAGEMRPSGFRTCGRSGIPERRRRIPWRLRGFAAYPLRVPGRFWALVTRSDSGVRGGGVSVAPAGAGCSWGDGTQRSRAGLSSGGPPGLGPRLGRALREPNRDADSVPRAGRVAVRCLLASLRLERSGREGCIRIGETLSGV